MENRVAHKSPNLERYLEAISGNMSEKTEILEHINRRKGGTYLEVGTGGDSISAILRSLPDGVHIHLIGIDADPEVLNELLRRHPYIPDLVDQKSSELELLPIDATDMTSFPPEVFDGVNASALVHEIFSYADKFEGVRHFIRETTRVLKPEGVLVYRDPELMHPLERVEMKVTDKTLKAFSLIYLMRAAVDDNSRMDESHINLNRLDSLYDTESLTVALTLKGDDITTSFRGITSLMTIDFRDVDFGKDITITCENGLAKEIQRHFLTFHQCSPYGNIHIHNTQNSHIITEVSPGTNERFEDFVMSRGISAKLNSPLTEEAFEEIKRNIDDVFAFLFEGTEIYLTDSTIKDIRDLLSILNIDESKFFYDIGDTTSIVDTKLLSLLYSKLSDANAITLESFSDSVVANFFSYIQQEAQELYFYLTPDEIIALCAYESMKSQDYILVPLSFEPPYNKSSRRQHYESYLESTVVVNSFDHSVSDNELTPSDTKRVIHFRKAPLQEGLGLLKEVVETSPTGYPAIALMLQNAGVM